MGSELDTPQTATEQLEPEDQQNPPEEQQEGEENLESAAENTEKEAKHEATLEEISQALEEAKEKTDQSLDQLARSRADLDNLRKRHHRELENAHKYALDGFAKELLQVRDSMEMGMTASTDDKKSDLETIREGMELTIKLFDDTLGKFNVERINPEGQPFNPDLHQAMSMIPNDDVAPNTVITVVQKGYTLNGRLLRPALVMVSQATA